MRRTALITASILVGLAGSVAGARDAAAQPGMTPNAPAPAPASPAPRPPVEGELSAGKALGLSLAMTAASWGLTALAISGESAPVAVIGGLGTLLAPTAGHWYAGGTVTRGLVVRTVALAVGTVAFFQWVDCPEGGCDNHAEDIMVGSALLYVVATVDDIVTAPLRARRYNRRLREDFTLVPLAMAGHRGGAGGGGLALAGRF